MRRKKQCVLLVETCLATCSRARVPHCRMTANDEEEQLIFGVVRSILTICLVIVMVQTSFCT